MQKVKVLLLVFVCVLIGLFTITGANADNKDIVREGDPMPVFELKNGDDVIKSKDLKGKVVLVNFFATWCPPCVKELPHLQNDVWEKYKNHDDFVLLVIGREHSSEELAKFANTRQLSLPFYPDQDRSVYSLFASSTIPRNYIIDKNGKVIYASTGFNTEEFDELKATLADQLN